MQIIKSRKGNAPVTIIIFIVFIGMLAGAYATFNISSSVNPCPVGQTTVQFTTVNGQNYIGCIPSNNAQIGQIGIGQSNQITTTGINTISIQTQTVTSVVSQTFTTFTTTYTTVTTVTNSGTSSTTGCNPQDPLYVVCVANALGTLAYCDLSILFGAPCQTSTVDNAITGNGVLGGQSSSATVTSAESNIFLYALSTPLGQALAVLALFLSLGLLAGLFGAGILAGGIAGAGIVLSIVTYTEGILGAFGTIPSIIYVPFQTIIGGLMIILIYETVRGARP